MVNKKAQAQIITTILIILLVLAAIVIIWQVISGTIEEGASEINSQSNCLGLRIDVTNVELATPGEVTFRPTKNITGYQVYINGESKGPSGSQTDPVLALKTKPVTIVTGVSAGDEIEIVPVLGETNCQGYKTKAK